jgi:thiamine biosynthesis protein ThiI
MKERVGREAVKCEFDSFRISARRADKRFPLNSQQINTEVGAHVQELTGKRVDLAHPELNIHLEVMPGETFLYLRKIEGAGGLPVGAGGVVVALLSGGIDSPVAACRMMRRGCRVIFVHFHSFPYLNRKSQDKAQELARHLTRRQYESLLYLVPFGDVQKEVVVQAPAPYRVVLYRRLMLRIAARFAGRHGAGALVTGESLGQVASQTLENISAIEQAVDMPVLRPLIGMDKNEISEQAMAMGTYQTSIIPDQDCCQLFTPRQPVTRSRLQDVLKAESALDVPRLVEQAVCGAEERRYTFP